MGARFLVLLLFFAAVNVSSMSSEPVRHIRGSRKLLQVVDGTYDVLPRRDLAGHSVNHNFCAQDNSGNCHWDTYFEVMGVMAVPGLLLAVLSLLALPTFLVMRFCCNCWGGAKESPGLFFGGFPGDRGVCWNNDDKDWKPYTTGRVLNLRMALFLCLLLLLVMSVVGFAGNRRFDAGVSSFGDTLSDTADEIITQAKQLAQNLTSLPYTQSAAADLDKMVSTVQGYQSQAETVKTRAYLYNNYRSAAALTCFTLPLVVLILGCLGMVASLPRITFVAGVFCFIVSIFSWLSFAVMWPMTTVGLDVCRSIDSFLAVPTNISSSNASVPVDFSSPAGLNPAEVILKCQNGDMFKPVFAHAASALQKAYDTSHESIIEACSMPLVSCSGIPPSANISTLPLYRDMIITDVLLGCYDTASSSFLSCPATNGCSGPTLHLESCNASNITVAECAVSCHNATLRNLTSVFIDNINLLLIYNSVMKDQLLPLLDCSYVYDAFSTIRSALCVDVAEGIDSMTSVSGIIGAVLIPTTFFLVMGYKRFKRHVYEDLADELILGKRYDVDREERPWNGVAFQDVRSR